MCRQLSMTVSAFVGTSFCVLMSCLAEHSIFWVVRVVGPQAINAHCLAAPWRLVAIRGQNSGVAARMQARDFTDCRLRISLIANRNVRVSRWLHTLPRKQTQDLGKLCINAAPARSHSDTLEDD